MHRDILEEIKTKDYKEILSSVKDTDILFLSCSANTIQLNRNIYCNQCPYGVRCNKSKANTRR